jgi:hypothetical protein
VYVRVIANPNRIAARQFSRSFDDAAFAQLLQAPWPFQQDLALPSPDGTTQNNPQSGSHSLPLSLNRVALQTVFR